MNFGGVVTGVRRSQYLKKTTALFSRMDLETISTRLDTFAKGKDALTGEHLREVNEILKELVEGCKEAPLEGARKNNVVFRGYRGSIPCAVFQSLNSLASHWIKTDNKDDIYELMCNLLRFGRNSTIACRRNQNFTISSGFISIPITFLQEEAPKMCQPPLESDLVLLCLSMQMVCNCMMSNVEVTEKLTRRYKFFDTTLTMLELFEDERLQGYATMTGYNIVSLLGYGDNVNVNMKDRLKAFEIAMRKMKTEDGEAYRLWFSVLVESDTFISTVYQEMKPDTRVQMVKTIVDHKPHLTDKKIVYFRDQFKQLAQVVVDAPTPQVPELITAELGSLLSLLASWTSDTDMQHSRTMIFLQSDAQLVGLVNQLLKAVHLAGKEGKNSLTPIEKIQDLTNSMLDLEIQSTPTYDFKSNLIRLIGTLSHNHQDNQTIALEVETLPIILECTKIDGRNPFVPQCAIFAMKCLLKDHEGNQKFVEQMNKISDKQPPAL